MKKAIAILLAFTMMFSFAACGETAGASQTSAVVKEETKDAAAETKEESVEAETEEPEVTEAAAEEPAAEAEEEADEEEAEPEDVLLQVGDTAEGEICAITVNSVEYVNKIENGLKFEMWSPAVQENYQDVYAEEGYSIVKISYHIDYSGKESGFFTLGIELDYDDGYTFNTNVSHLEPKAESGVGFKKTYDFPTYNSFTVEDPLNYKGEDAEAYIVVNDVVLTDTDKSLVMRISIPTAPDTLEQTSYGEIQSYDYKQSDAEIFTYDLRSVEFDLTAAAEAEGPAEDERVELTGKVIGPNPHNPSLNEKYGNNSWDIKFGDNPVRKLVFFQEDVDVTPYIGKEITFSFTYDDGNCVDAFIVE